MVHTFTVCELAVAIAYIMMNKKDPVKTAKLVVEGYHKVLPLTELEIKVLFYFVCARLCSSVILAAYQRTVQPDGFFRHR